MGLSLIDIGANLTDKAFRSDLEDVLARAQRANVNHIVVTGTDIEHSRRALDLCGQHSGYLSSTAGIHPHNAASVQTQTIQQLTQIARNKCVVAIGETGLDYFRNFSPRLDQISAFETQLQLAVELELPAFIHDRDSKGELLAILKNFPNLSAVIHCFTGSASLLQDYLDLGLYIGITGWICDERRGLELYQCVNLIPDERLLIETDSPYLIPRSMKPRPRSRRNEPSFLEHVCITLAAARGQTFEHVQQITQQNAKTLFGLDF
ncbi:MAG: YchF/TatD family DNA exonuclease [Gammaproteobacteria bacterium]|nr:YchF/TatD family DNA exonuclease [Gammaproteobacteria bacterium]MYF01890.1 YchF/TatD family DNA exonuclease [Gammaproteobacteria bacterium]MYI77268.1 YchF/TatD family DNA exonuclease [Gammaproteobacteria bacterium]